MRFASLLALLLTVSALHAAPTPRTWTVDGVQREALVHVPESAKTTAAPVIFAFHGHGGTMLNASRMGYHTLWPEAIVVYPQGLNTPGQLTDPEGKKSGWQANVGDQGDRDLKLFDAILASLKADYKVDESRIYSTGHSNGGGFTYLLWRARGEHLAAVAPSAAAAGRRYATELKPKPCLHVAGENDPLVKFAWQQAMFEIVKKTNNIAGEGQPWKSSGDLKGLIYNSPQGTPLVTLIHPGGHKFHDKAPALIVEFFKQHKKQ